MEGCGNLTFDLKMYSKPSLFGIRLVSWYSLKKPNITILINICVTYSGLSCVLVFNILSNVLDQIKRKINTLIYVLCV